MSSAGRCPALLFHLRIFIQLRQRFRLTCKLLQTLNSALERTKTTHYAPVTIDALQARLTEELDWLEPHLTYKNALFCPGAHAPKPLPTSFAENQETCQTPAYFSLACNKIERAEAARWSSKQSRESKSFRSWRVADRLSGIVASELFDRGSGNGADKRKRLGNRINGRPVHIPEDVVRKALYALFL